MPSNRKKLGDLLVDAGAIDAMQLQAALGFQRQWGGKLGAVLVDRGFISEPKLVQTLAAQLGVSVVQISKAPVDTRALALVPPAVAATLRVFPLELKGPEKSETMVVAMSDPTDLTAIDQLQFRTRKRIQAVLAGDRDISTAIRRHYHNEDVPPPEETPAPAPGKSNEARPLASSADKVPGLVGRSDPPAPRPTGPGGTVVNPMVPVGVPPGFERPGARGPTGTPVVVQPVRPIPMVAPPAPPAPAPATAPAGIDPFAELQPEIDLGQEVDEQSWIEPVAASLGEDDALGGAHHPFAAAAPSFPPADSSSFVEVSGAGAEAAPADPLAAPSESAADDWASVEAPAASAGEVPMESWDLPPEPSAAPDPEALAADFVAVEPLAPEAGAEGEWQEAEPAEAAPEAAEAGNDWAEPIAATTGFEPSESAPEAAAEAAAEPSAEWAEPIAVESAPEAAAEPSAEWAEPSAEWAEPSAEWAEPSAEWAEPIVTTGFEASENAAEAAAEPSAEWAEAAPGAPGAENWAALEPAAPPAAEEEAPLTDGWDGEPAAPADSLAAAGEGSSEWVISEEEELAATEAAAAAAAAPVAAAEVIPVAVEELAEAPEVFDEAAFEEPAAAGESESPSAAFEEIPAAELPAEPPAEPAALEEGWSDPGEQEQPAMAADAAPGESADWAQAAPPEPAPELSEPPPEISESDLNAAADWAGAAEPEAAPLPPPAEAESAATSWALADGAPAENQPLPPLAPRGWEVIGIFNPTPQDAVLVVGTMVDLLVARGSLTAAELATAVREARERGRG